MASPSSSSESPCWDYDGAKGASHWGDLHPDWVLCGEGQKQSPIALPPTVTAADHRLAFEYSTVQAQLNSVSHTVRIDVGPGARLFLDEREFALVQFHFHTPAEHRWSDTKDPAELHLVHISDSKDIAVLGVPLRYQVSQALPQDLWQHITAAEPVTPFEIDLSEMLPRAGHYLSYSGSLTTPPCTEGIHWLLASEPMAIEEHEAAWLKRQTGANARPIQALGDRAVYSLNRLES